MGNSYYAGANLDYLTNYEQLHFFQRYDAGITKVDVTFTGNKTQLPVTDDSEHPLRSELEGTFIVHAQKYESATGVDVDYIDTAVISMAGYNPIIDNQVYDVGVFYTYYTSNVLWNQGIEQRDLYWVQESIYLDHKTLPVGTTDTIHHVFAGNRI